MYPQDNQSLPPSTPQPQVPLQQPAAPARVDNALSVTQPGERTLCTIRRHPIGILGIYVMSGLLLMVLSILAFVVAPHIFPNVSSSQVMLGGALVFLVVAVACTVFSLISTKVYWGNSWVLTTDSLTQISQSSLFNRQSSQLSLGNLEDVTAEQNGVLCHMFNYGLIKVETAGERSKFVFTYCPNPNYFAQQVLAAREAFEQGKSGENLQRTYRDQGTYQASPPQNDNYDPGVNINR